MFHNNDLWTSLENHSPQFQADSLGVCLDVSLGQQSTKGWPFSFSALSLWKDSSFQAETIFHSPASVLFLFEEKSVNILSDPSLSTADSTPKILSVALGIPVRMPCRPGARSAGGSLRSTRAGLTPPPQPGAGQLGGQWGSPGHQPLPWGWGFHYCLELQVLKHPTKTLLAVCWSFLPVKLKPYTY